MISLWIELGFDHILDINGYDHILYLVTLCAIYSIKEWKRVLVLATAFTIGHSITLALNAWGWVRIPPDIIEALIPITIILTALFNLLFDNKKGISQKVGYLIALVFGFIHGMGISNFLKTMMGKNDSLVLSLLGFNIGVELAQILVVSISLVFSFIIIDIIKVKKLIWLQMVSIVSILICVYLLFK